MVDADSRRVATRTGDDERLESLGVCRVVVVEPASLTSYKVTFLVDNICLKAPRLQSRRNLKVGTTLGVQIRKWIGSDAKRRLASTLANQVGRYHLIVIKSLFVLWQLESSHTHDRAADPRKGESRVRGKERWPTRGAAQFGTLVYAQGWQLHLHEGGHGELGKKQDVAALELCLTGALS